MSSRRSVWRCLKTHEAGVATVIAEAVTASVWFKPRWLFYKTTLQNHHAFLGLNRMNSKWLLLTLAIGAASAVGWFAIIRGDGYQTVRLSTGSELGVYYRVGKEIGEAFENRYPLVRCDIAQTEGSRENVLRLRNGLADVAILQNDAVAGENIRSLALLYTEVLHLVCRRGEGIQCLNDLVDQPTNLGSRSGGTYPLVKELLRFSRVEIPVSNQKNIGFAAAGDGLRSGDIDAAFFLVGVGAEIVQDLISNPEFELVPIQIRAFDDKDGFVPQQAFINGFQAHYPHATFAEIPLMSYEGRPTTPMPSVGIGAVLACRDSWDNDLARELVRSVFAHRAVLGRKISLLSGLDEHSSQNHLQFPLHGGAEAYYRRNEPGFLAENAESMGLLITLALLIASGVHAMKKWIVQRRKNRVDVYYGRVQGIANSMRQSDSFRFDDAFRELNEIESTACEELINERLDADHSYVILQNMIARCRTEIERSQRESAMADDQTLRIGIADESV